MAEDKKKAASPKGSRVAPKRGRATAVKNVLYCSFCGKSQEEVRKLIAGPTVLICDECTELCADIISVEDEIVSSLPDGRNRIVLNVSLGSSLSADELSTVPSLVNEVSKAFPDCEVKLFRYIPSGLGDTLRLEVAAPSAYEIENLKAEIRELTILLRIEQQKFLSEQSERERLQQKVSQLMDDFYPLAVEKLRKSGQYPDSRIRNLSLMFIDISGFSIMSDDERRRSLDMLRSLGAVLLRSERALYMNTWGDAVVAAFEEVDDCLRCACKFSQQFSLIGMNARIGVSWGSVRISNNEIVGGDDFDGDAANMGARLEAIADIGTVLCSEEVALISGLESEKFYFAPKQKNLSKRVGDKVSGEEIRAYEVTSKLN